MNDINIDITPSASIYSIFTRLNYKEEYALAEFVDNSTASFFSHEEELKANAKLNKMTIDIGYDIKSESIYIVDNAYGMELEDFKRAILLDAKPEKQGGRNEYGMGLKTAATWFGGRWSVSSTQYGSENKYYAYIDIDELVYDNKNMIDIKTEYSNPAEHGTRIVISKLNRKISSTTVKNKIQNILSAMYRRDIESGNVEIIFNGKKLTYEEPQILVFRNKTWKKDLNFVVHNDEDDKIYRVKGFVGIMNPGGYDKTGFSLFRRERVVVGGPGQNYKPKAIFEQAQSQISLKLFGELDLDDFPINQAKDGFAWDGHLEELFIAELKKNILEYINISKISKKDRENEEERARLAEEERKNKEDEINISSDNNIEEVLNNELHEEIDDNNETLNNNADDFEEISEETDDLDTDFNEPNEIPNVLDYNFENNGENYRIRFVDKNIELYEFHPLEKEFWVCISHRFINRLSDKEKILISKILFIFVLSIKDAGYISKYDGHIKTTFLESKLNYYLNIMGD